MLLSSSRRNWVLDVMKELSRYYADNSFITKEEFILAPRQRLIFGNNKVSGFLTDNARSIYINMMVERDDDVRVMSLLLDMMMTLSSSNRNSH